IGAGILIPLSEVLHAELGHVIPGIQGVIFGIAIVVLILAAPEGLFWQIRDIIQKRWPGLITRPKFPVLDEIAQPSSNDAQEPGRDRSGDVVLEVRELSRSFGGLTAVDKVSFA